MKEPLIAEKKNRRPGFGTAVRCLRMLFVYVAKTGEMIGRGFVRGREAHGGDIHACGECRFDTGVGILGDDAVRGLQPQLFGGDEKHIGRGLGARDIIAVGNRVEAVKLSDLRICSTGKLSPFQLLGLLPFTLFHIFCVTSVSNIQKPCVSVTLWEV